MEISGSPTYIDEEAKPVFGCNKGENVIPPTEQEFLKGNKIVDAQLNVTVLTVEQLQKETSYNKGG